MAGIAARPSYARGYALLIGVALGWGINWPMMKIIVSEVSVWEFRALSGIAAGLLLLGLAIGVSRSSGEAWKTPREQWLPLGLAALFNVTSWFILIGFGVSMMGAGHAVIMAFTMPLFAAAIGVIFLGEALTRRRLTALCLGAAGIGVLMSHDFSVIGAEPLGFALTLTGAALWSVGVLIQKHTPWRVGVLALSGWQILLGTTPIFAVWLALDEFAYRARTLMQKLALALFDDAGRAGEVLARINRTDRGWADAVRWSNRKAHGAGDVATDLPPMVSATERLARWLSKCP